MSALMMGIENGSDSEGESLPAQPSYMSKTISSQGKTKRRGLSQENLDRGEPPKLRISSSEQNLAKGMVRSKGAVNLGKAQPVHGIQKGLAVVTGVRQGGREEDPPLNLETALSSVDSLRKSMNQVLHLRNRVSRENIPDREPIGRILEDGLYSAQRLLHQSVLFTEQSPPKILTEHEATDL